jgi:hypothetical protein
MKPVVLAALLMAGALVCVDGHGYLMVPRSRNKFANDRGVGGQYDYCPNCKNAGGLANVKANDVLGGVWARNFPETEKSLARHGLCGDNAGQAELLVGGKFYGNPAGGNVQATYTSGQSIDINIIITAHHMGWFQFYLCDKGDELSQTCLNKYMLQRDQNDPSISPYDPKFPGRYYMIPTCYGEAKSMNQTMRYKLPAGLACEHCVLQWYWVTANSCHGGGYSGVNFPTAPAACSGDGGSTGWYPRANSACVDNPSIYPEEFWNCADIRIEAPSGPTPFPTTPKPTTKNPTPLPTTPTATPATKTPTTPTATPATKKPTGKPTPAAGACSALYGQCGGQGWAGATCCLEGSKCVKSTRYYSQCQADASATCVQPWQDCTTNSRCCAGSTCVTDGANYKQCLPQ